MAPGRRVGGRANRWRASAYLRWRAQRARHPRRHRLQHGGQKHLRARVGRERKSGASAAGASRGSSRAGSALGRHRRHIIAKFGVSCALLSARAAPTHHHHAAPPMFGAQQLQLPTLLRASVWLGGRTSCCAAAYWADACAVDRPRGGWGSPVSVSRPHLHGVSEAPGIHRLRRLQRAALQRHPHQLRLRRPCAPCHAVSAW